MNMMQLQKWEMGFMYKSCWAVCVCVVLVMKLHIMNYVKTTTGGIILAFIYTFVENYTVYGTKKLTDL